MYSTIFSKQNRTVSDSDGDDSDHVKVRDDAEAEPKQLSRSYKRRRGRPKRARNRKTITRKYDSVYDASPDNTWNGITQDNDHRRKGRHFSEREELCLAKAWVLQLHKHPSQMEKTMWGGIAECMEVQFNLKRAPVTYRVKWQILQRQAIIYLGAMSAANNRKQGRKCGLNAEDVEQLTMRLYCLRAGRKNKNGHIISVPPFKYISAAHYLSRLPKFGGSDESVQCRPTKPSDGRGLNTTGECAREDGEVRDDNGSLGRVEEDNIIPVSVRRPLGEKSKKEKTDRPMHAMTYCMH